MRGNKSVSIGVDLAGSELRNTGIASLDSSLKLEHGVLHRDREVIQYASNSQPDVIVIDAPLSLPRGRENLEKKSNIHFRECDFELRRRHIPFFPLTLGPMRKLTARGINLARILRLEGTTCLKVIRVQRRHHEDSKKNSEPDTTCWPFAQAWFGH